MFEELAGNFPKYPEFDRTFNHQKTPQSMEIIQEKAEPNPMVRDVASATLPGSRDEVLKILKNKHISGVPVLKDSKVVGVVTRTNLLQNPEEEQLALLMTRDPITISSGSDLQTAARLLLEHRIRRLPVVDDGKLVGLVTVADVIGTIADMPGKESISLFLPA